MTEANIAAAFIEMVSNCDTMEEMVLALAEMIGRSIIHNVGSEAADDEHIFAIADLARSKIIQFARDERLKLQTN